MERTPKQNASGEVSTKDGSRTSDARVACEHVGCA